MNVPLTILGAVIAFVALALFVLGIGLFFTGTVRDRDTPRAQAAAASPVQALIELMRSAFKIAFGGNSYPKPQRMMAQGLLLITLSILMLLGSIGSMAAASSG